MLSVYAQVRLQGHSDAEEAVILQHTVDLRQGSPEKLVIVDLELHSNRFQQGLPVAPETMRTVHKLLPFVARRHLLISAHVASYCTWMADQCIVYHNDVEWPRDDHQLRQVDHGAYFRVVLPPPPRAEWEIGHAVRVAEDTGELFDFPEAGQLIHAVLNGEFDGNAPAFSTCHPQTRSCRGSEHTEDIDIPMTIPPGAPMPSIRPPHDGTLDWLLQLGAVFRTDSEVETIEGLPMLYVQTCGTFIMNDFSDANIQGLCVWSLLPLVGLMSCVLHGVTCLTLTCHSASMWWLHDLRNYVFSPTHAISSLSRHRVPSKQSGS